MFYEYPFQLNLSPLIFAGTLRSEEDHGGLAIWILLWVPEGLSVSYNPSVMQEAKHKSKPSCSIALGLHIILEEPRIEEKRLSSDVIPFRSLMFFL